MLLSGVYNNMKKNITIILAIVLISSLMLTSCMNYKAYDVEDNANETDEELDLIQEIEEIEKQLEDNDLVEGDETEDAQVIEEDPVVVVEEEVTIPNMEENTEDLTIIEIDENELVKLNVNIVDPDEDKVTYSFTPPIDKSGEWKTNYGDAGEYYVTLTASDSELTTTREILLVVNRVNVAPEVETLSDLTFNEGDLIEFAPEVSDPNNDAVTVTVSEPLASGTFSTDHTSAGSYEIFVVASDGELDTETSFMLNIGDVNELPVITGVYDSTINEGETITIVPEVSDLDGDDLEITISEPVGDDGVWETNFTDHGEYQITVSVDDGKNVVETTIVLTVEDVNMPPEIVDISLDVDN